MAGELIIPVDCMECTITWRMSGKSNPITSTIGVHDSASGDFSGILDELVEGLSMDGGLCDPDYMLTGWTLEGATGVANVAGIMEGFSSTGAPVVGTASASSLMIVSSAMLLQKRTARIGRHFRGRMYLPVLGINEGSIDAMGVMAPSIYTEASNHATVTTDFWLASVTWETVLLHTDTVVTPAFTPIASYALQQKCATQRRRLRS